MKNLVIKISHKALESLQNSPSNEPYLNNFYRIDTKLERKKYERNFPFLQIFISLACFMGVNEINWNLAELVAESSVFKRDREQLNIIVGFRVGI